MVILTSSGLKDKEKSGDLLKLVKNKKVFICNNAIERKLYRESHFKVLKENIQDVVVRLDEGELNSENIQKYIEYYDCIYLAEGNLRILSDMLGNKVVKQSILNFINKGKLFMTEGLSTYIASDSLEYLNYIIKSLDQEDMIYNNINYEILNNLALTNKKFIVHADNLTKKFKGACRLAEKNMKLSLKFLNDGEFVVL